MSGSPAFRRDVMEALADEFAGEHRPHDQREFVASAPARRGPRSVIKSLARPWVARYLRPRLAREVQIAFDQARMAREDLSNNESERLDALTGQLEALTVNGELLEAQLQAVNHKLERLVASINAMGMAIAPTAGIDGVPDRFAEFRERLNAVERRTRDASAADSPPLSGQLAARAGHRARSAGSSSAIDYVGFERRFRGDSAHVQEVTRDRYLELLRDQAPVLDVGCGKGELVNTLVGAGVAAVGIDLDEAMVAEAQANGLDVEVADLNEFLEGTPEYSFGSIISTQVIEHLQIRDLVRFLELSVTRLRPGGTFIAETPNPASLIVLGTHFILDPTHVRPIHPALMVYLCECAGFRSVELKFYEPARQYHLAMIEEDDESAWIKRVNANFTRLNDVLFGPQDYAVLARTPG